MVDHAPGLRFVVGSRFAAEFKFWLGAFGRRSAGCGAWFTTRGSGCRGPASTLRLTGLWRKSDDSALHRPAFERGRPALRRRCRIDDRSHIFVLGLLSPALVGEPGKATIAGLGGRLSALVGAGSGCGVASALVGLATIFARPTFPGLADAGRWGGGARSGLLGLAAVFSRPTFPGFADAGLCGGGAATAGSASGRRALRLGPLSRFSLRKPTRSSPRAALRSKSTS